MLTFKFKHLTMQNYNVTISYATYIARTRRFNMRTRHFNTRTPFFNTFKQKSRKRNYFRMRVQKYTKNIDIIKRRGLQTSFVGGYIFIISLFLLQD